MPLTSGTFSAPRARRLVCASSLSEQVEPLQAFWAKQADPTMIVAMLAGYVRGGPHREPLGGSECAVRSYPLAKGGAYARRACVQISSLRP